MARNKDALDAAVTMLREAGAPDAVGLGVDMADADSIAAGFATVAGRWGQLNTLVHTIGPGDGYFEQMVDADWQAAFDLGTMSGVRSIRASLPLLRAADWARIVTLSAHSIQRQNPRIVAYTASKAALSSVTKNRPARRHDMDRQQLPPTLRPRARRTAGGDRLDHHLPRVEAQWLCHRCDGERRRRLRLRLT
jgi:NAD(P)-dependent dehydrogenase (short-subunit alcohol dehydrogenase family)